jgi:hypothetical protein
MEALYSSETLVPTHKSTQRYYPEQKRRHFHRRQKV